MTELSWGVTAALVLALVATARGGEAIELWPADRLPEAKQPEKAVESEWRGKWTIARLQHVSKPTLTVFPAEKPNGAAIVVCPGGGYGILAWDLEGIEVCQWLNGLGVTAFLLKYRVPKQRDAALADAQRAMGLVRHGAKGWGIDPKRIGILGFSAGGHLAARACTNSQKRSYEPVDDADTESPRPDFAVLIYPAYMAAKGGGLDAQTLPVAKHTPPAFVAIACNDRFAPGALAYFGALRQARVRSELHVFAVGGHGCGLRPVDEGLATWPAHCQRWLEAAGLLAR